MADATNISPLSFIKRSALGRCLFIDVVNRRSFPALVLVVLVALLLEYLSYQKVAVISWVTPRLWLAGRSKTALQVGFAWPFWLGLLLFADSLRTWGREKGIRWSDGLAMAAVSALLVFPYMTEYYLYFEQTLFSVCFSLQAIGWLLLFLIRPTPFRAFALCWISSMLVYCYTTSLAAVVLLIVLLMAMCIKALLPSQKALTRPAALSAALTAGPYPAMSGLVAAGVILAVLAFSLAFGRGDRISVMRSTELSKIIEATKAGLSIAFLHRPAVYAGYLLPLVWLYLIFALFFRFGLAHFIVAGWTLGVIVLSQVLQGYAIYPAAISFSRTLVTVPVLVTAWYLLTADRLQANGITQTRPARRHLGVSLLALIILLNLSAGTWNLGRPVVQGSAAQYIAPARLSDMRFFITDLNKTAAAEQLAADDRFNLVLYTDNVWLKNPDDYTCYFFPDARVMVLSSDMPLPDNLDLQAETLFYVIQAKVPEQQLAGLGQLEAVSGTANGRTLQMQRLIYQPER